MFKDITATDPRSVADFNRFIRTIEKYEEHYLPLRYSRKVEGMHETGYRTKEDLEKYVIIMSDVSSSVDKKFLTSAIYFLYKVLMQTNYRKIRVDVILFAERANRYERTMVSKPENI